MDGYCTTMDGIMARAKKTNYLNNKDMLKEIHKSKISFSEFDGEEYEKPSFILENRNMDVDTIRQGVYEVRDLQELYDYVTSIEVLAEAKQNLAKRLQQERYQAALAEKPDAKIKASEFVVDPDTLEDTDLVFRVLTFSHIPEDLERKKTHKTVADRHVQLNFNPFKHYVIDGDSLREVGRSHSKDGEFTAESGQITNTLAKMFMLLVNRYAERSNWRGYTYIDEMKGQALLQLSHRGLQFEEMKSNNPFAYFTAVLTNSFTRVLNTEKNNQNLRDNLLESFGQMPSFSRQLKYEEEARKHREDLDKDNF